MGAVFALFAAWFFWSPKAEGLTYNDRKGRLHFWGLFIGVNSINILAPSLVLWLNEILFDTRKGFIVLKNSFFNYIKDNYSIKLLYVFYNINLYLSIFYLIKIYWFKYYFYIFKFFILTNNYLHAKLVEVKNSVPSILKYNNADIHKASQRLNTKDIHWLVGFTDGDGCLTMYKEKKYINNWRHEFSIGLSIKDIRVLYKIKKILGCGVIRKYNNIAIFKIKKIKHLVFFIIPIFDKYPLLTNKKRLLYLNYRNTLLKKAFLNKKNIFNDKDIIYIKQLMENIPNDIYNISIKDLFINIDNNFFINWIVGFTEAEGSFYFVKTNNTLRAEFRLGLNDNFFLLNKIKEKLKLSRKVNLQSNSSNHYYIIAVSQLSLQNVINFFFNPKIVKFKGIKHLQFILWLKGIKNIVNYSKLNIPINYSS